MNNKLMAVAASVLGAALMNPAAASTAIFSDNFNDGDVSDWSIATGSKGSTEITVTDGALETFFSAPASLGAGYAGATHGFELAGAATDVRLNLDGHTAGCEGCTMRYQAFVDGNLLIDGTDLSFTNWDVVVGNLGAGHHDIVLRHFTDGASSGHFTAFFDNVVVSGNLAPVPLPGTTWLLAPALGGLGFMRRRRA